MKIISEVSLREFEAWGGAVETKERIIKEGKEQEFEELIEEMYPNGIDATTLNDVLWFDNDWIYSCLGIENSEDE